MMRSIRYDGDSNKPCHYHYRYTRRRCPVAWPCHRAGTYGHAFNWRFAALTCARRRRSCRSSKSITSIVIAISIPATSFVGRLPVGAPAPPRAERDEMMRSAGRAAVNTSSPHAITMHFVISHSFGLPAFPAPCALFMPCPPET